MESEDQDRGASIGRVVIGLMIVAFGLALLLNRLGYPVIALDGRFWPFVVAAFGVVRLLYPPPGRSRRGGAWLLYIAFWGYVSEFHVWGLDYGTSWPLMIVGVGLATIWRAFERPRCHPQVRS